MGNPLGKKGLNKLNLETFTDTLFKKIIFLSILKISTEQDKLEKGTVGAINCLNLFVMQNKDRNKK